MNYNTDITLLSNYREHLVAKSPTNSACLYVYANGCVTNSMEVISQFTNGADAEKALKKAGFKKFDKSAHFTTYKA